jgi:hypothetical protein
MEMITFILGMVLRIGIPVAVTFLLVWLFHRLDARWQSQAEQGEMPSAPRWVANRGCWELNNCSQENQGKCPAFAHPEMPCWQVFRSGDGTLREKCQAGRSSFPVPA